MLKKEKTVGKIILDHLSMEFTSAKSGMVIFNCEARLRSRLFFWAIWRSSAFRSKLCLPRPALRYCRFELSYVNMVFRGSLSPSASSVTPMSFLISKVPKRMFSCGSICPKKGKKFETFQWFWSFFMNFHLQTQFISSLKEINQWKKWAVEWNKNSMRYPSLKPKIVIINSKNNSNNR